MRFIILLLFTFSCEYQGQCEVPVAYQWESPPHTIEFCTDTRIDKVRVIEQFQWWHDNISVNYPYLTYDDNMIVTTCEDREDDRPAPGVIRIRSADVGYLITHTAGAYTSYHVASFVVEDSPGTYNTLLGMDAATIYLKPWNTNRVIRHEIGHAYGWDHVPDGDHHVMSPTTGDNQCGLDITNFVSGE